MEPLLGVGLLKTVQNKIGEHYYNKTLEMTNHRLDSNFLEMCTVWVWEFENIQLMGWVQSKIATNGGCWIGGIAMYGGGAFPKSCWGGPSLSFHFFPFLMIYLICCSNIE